MTPFDKQFGEWNETQQAYVLPTYYLSLLNSLVYVGFAAGMLPIHGLLTTVLIIIVIQVPVSAASSAPTTAGA